MRTARRARPAGSAPPRGAPTPRAPGRQSAMKRPEPAFVQGTYDLRGEVVDGWETRRHTGGDWAIVRLGVGGRLHAIDVDTRFFSGNHPTGCRIDACVLQRVADPTAATVAWTTVV